MSDHATEFFSIKIKRPHGVTETCWINCLGIKQGSFTRTDPFGWTETGVYVNDLEEGLVQVMVDGIVRRWGHKHFGKWNGPVFDYFADGTLAEKTNYVNGHPRGGTKRWDAQNGDLVKLGTNDADHYFTGIRASYHGNHIPKNITYYKKDQPFGLDPFFDPRGVLVQLDRYDERGILTSLTGEDQAILKLARFFEYKDTPAYAIVTAEQRRAVEAFQKRYPKSAFAEVFKPQTEQMAQANHCIQEALAIPHAPEVVCHHTGLRRHSAKKEAPGINIAHPIFLWLPSLARVRG